MGDYDFLTNVLNRVFSQRPTGNRGFVTNCDVTMPEYAACCTTQILFLLVERRVTDFGGATPQHGYMFRPYWYKKMGQFVVYKARL